MTIYNREDLVETGFKGILDFTGKCTDYQELPGTYGQQAHVKYSEVVVHEHEDPSFDKTVVSELTLYYPIKNTKKAAWGDILDAYANAGAPFPNGVVGKTLTLRRAEIMKGKSKETGEEFVSRPMLPTSGETTAATTKLAEYSLADIPAAFFDAVKGQNVPAAKRWVAGNKAGLPTGMVDDSKSGALYERLEGEGLISVNEGVITVEV